MRAAAQAPRKQAEGNAELPSNSENRYNSRQHPWNVGKDEGGHDAITSLDQGCAFILGIPAEYGAAVKSKGTPMANSPRMILRARVRVVAWTLILLVALTAPGTTPRANGEASHVQPIRTAKERLGGKASDEQRVDNCKVPLDLRGPKPRPAECGDSATTEAKH